MTVTDEMDAMARYQAAMAEQETAIERIPVGLSQRERLVAIDNILARCLGTIETLGAEVSPPELGRSLDPGMTAALDNARTEIHRGRVEIQAMIRSTP